jgi:TRAP-type transport system periplasmic protein
MRMRFPAFAAAAALAMGSAVHAQEVVLKVHHPLPPTSMAHQKVLKPWCDKLAAESNNRLKCQIYPSLQLGGNSAQLYDQVKDGVVDVVWTIPGYSAGRFPLSEVFELPFMMHNAEATSKAVWEYVQSYASDEYKDVKPLAFHTHGGGVFHMVKTPITKRSDFRGLKVRAPTRQTNKYMAVLGATPVGMPVPQVPEALSKGVIDGALLPYEVVPALKVQELTKFHSGPDASQGAIYTSVFILAMNRAKYDSLPADLKRVIDANSGIALSGRIGRVFAEGETTGKQLVPANSINVIPNDEIERWKKAAQPVIDGWVKDVTDKGADGKALLRAAESLMAKYSK